PAPARPSRRPTASAPRRPTSAGWATCASGSRRRRSARCRRPSASIPPWRSIAMPSACCTLSSAVRTWRSPSWWRPSHSVPGLADAHFHLGTAYAENGRWEDAVASYRKALALPTLAIPDLVHQNMGLALYHLKRYPEAESSLRFALSLDPKMQAGYYNLGL